MSYAKGMDTVGTQMAALKDAAGVSLRDIARAGDWSGASSVQKYFEPSYNTPLRPNVAARFARSLGEAVHSVSGTDGPPAPESGLRLCRQRAGFESATAAAKHFGWGESGYRHHENGLRALSLEDAQRYALAFSATLDEIAKGAPVTTIPDTLVINGIEYVRADTIR